MKKIDNAKYSATHLAIVLALILPLFLQEWLTKYGYLPKPDTSTGQLQAWTAVTEALKSMQRFAGLDDTGALGKNAKLWLNVFSRHDQ